MQAEIESRKASDDQRPGESERAQWAIAGPYGGRKGKEQGGVVAGERSPAGERRRIPLRREQDRQLGIVQRARAGPQAVPPAPAPAAPPPRPPALPPRPAS